MTLPLNHHIFHGDIRSAALANQLSACFNDRQLCRSIQVQDETTLVQIGSKFHTPFTVHISDIEVSVLVTKNRDHDWMDH